ncbi:MAG: hypothetical protein QNK26_01220 [Moritella sp.]|uniref:hypothetical protein n=1 Tax=Moritella sp. TaxID=78556 RepID=UPI0029B67C26|nr:hypothetical protein [Moritella sp.]MDX2319200.1 hypothetical protein [Moritella sp.]
MLANVLFAILLISLCCRITSAAEDPLRASVANTHLYSYPHQVLPPSADQVTPQLEFKQSIMVVKKSKRKRKHKRTAQLQLFNMWVDPDITRLFIPRLKDIGRLSLNLHYSLKRSPYLLLDYERLTIKSKVKSNGMLQHEAYYNMGIEGAIIGVKVRGQDPQLYFRYRFK